jgi:hypothetical protein
MKIGIYNLEPSYRNFALDKIRFYHTQKGDEVEDYFHLNYDSYDKIYMSSIFSWTPKIYIPKAIIGGSGYDVHIKLPPEIEEIKPHLNYGYCTRGCVRNCKFCLVRSKEGYIKPDGDLLDLWDGKSDTVRLLDNNALALLEHFYVVGNQAIDNHIKLDITQGLDFRFLTNEICTFLKKIPHVEYHFAFDNPALKSKVRQAIMMLQNAGIQRSTWYVLVGFDTTFQEDLERLNFLRFWRQNAYVQRYNLLDKPEYIPLARWANQHHIFQGMSWQEFINRPENNSYRELREKCLV